MTPVLILGPKITLAGRVDALPAIPREGEDEESPSFGKNMTLQAIDTIKGMQLEL